ncbi:DUF6049 family protein [Microbacterium sp. DT81.1]|uniref:DUF6049 family protein n=1 Tax=Microbacterium sp. DT81.1 TaxID=3393413 RepID=UPI003CEE9AAB
MTVTLPSSGTTARRWRRTLAGAVAALGVALTTVVGAPAVGVEPRPAVVVRSAEAVDLVLAPVGQGIVGPGEPLNVSMTIINDTTLPLAPAAVALSLGTVPLADRSELTAWLDEGAALDLQEVATGPSEAVAASSSSTFGLSVAADSPALLGRVPGVYALQAIYVGNAGPIVANSAMIVPEPNAPAAPIGVVVPITAPPIETGLLTPAQLTELTGTGGSLRAQLDAVDGTPAILAVDPAIAAAINVLGSSAPPEATEWLQRLEALANPRFALQFGDADVSAQLASGLPRPMAPVSLRSLLDPAFFVPPEPTAAPTPGPTPDSTPTAAPTEPVLPDLETLLGIGGSRTNVFWPPAGSAGPGIVDTLGRLGTDAVPSLTLLPSSGTVEGAAGATVPARGATPDGAAVLVYDAEISAALGQASMIDESAMRGAALTRATALLTFATQDAAGAPILVTPDRGQDRSLVALGVTIASVGRVPGAQLVPLAALTEASSSPVAVADASPEQARVDAASALTAEQDLLTDFSSILDEPALLTSPERISILQLLGIGWSPEPERWATAFATHRERTAATLGAVGIQPPSTIQLLSPEAPLPVWVRNDLPYPVNVVLYAEPDDPRLVVTPQTQVLASAAANTRVQVPVEARVGSGEVVIELRLLSPTGVSIGETQSADVTVRADWEGIGLIILAVLIVAFLGLGVVRMVLRRRRTKSADE